MYGCVQASLAKWITPVAAVMGTIVILDSVLTVIRSRMPTAAEPLPGTDNAERFLQVGRQ